jgi:glycosyltransferase involved in cell wall biosynthesis
MIFGAVYFVQAPTLSEKTLLLEHRKKDKTIQIELKTKVKIKTTDGRKIKGVLTDLHQDAVVVGYEVIPLSKIEHIKPYKKRGNFYWLAWIISILLVVGFALLLGALSAVGVGIILLLLFDPDAFLDGLATLAVVSVLGLLFLIGTVVYSLITKNRKYKTKNWSLRSIKS